MIGGQNSVYPTTAYARPLILGLSGPGSRDGVLLAFRSLLRYSAASLPLTTALICPRVLYLQLRRRVARS